MFSTLDIHPQIPKSTIIQDVRNIIATLNYQIVDEDVQRPWGGYFRFAEHHSQDFKAHFFAEVHLPTWAQGLAISPKILFTAPQKRLSWQYHNYRGEVQKVLRGQAAIYYSYSDDHPNIPIVLNESESIEIPVNYRHRFCAQDTWVIWAEMWVHTDPHHPSEENDNIRLSDDFGR